VLTGMLKSQVRRQVEANLPQRCRIERYTYAAGSLGGQEIAGTQVIESACFLTRVTRSAADLVAAAEQGRVFYTLHLPYDTDIQDQDAVFLILNTGAEIKYETVQVIRNQGVDVMRQAIVVKAGS
jgi:hypothetical protein